MVALHPDGVHILFAKPMSVEKYVGEILRGGGRGEMNA